MQVRFKNAKTIFIRAFIWKAYFNKKLIFRNHTCFLSCLGRELHGRSIRGEIVMLILHFLQFLRLQNYLGADKKEFLYLVSNYLNIKEKFCYCQTFQGF